MLVCYVGLFNHLRLIMYKLNDESKHQIVLYNEAFDVEHDLLELGRCWVSYRRMIEPYTDYINPYHHVFNDLMRGIITDDMKKFQGIMKTIEIYVPCISANDDKLLLVNELVNAIDALDEPIYVQV